MLPTLRDSKCWAVNGGELRQTSILGMAELAGLKNLWLLDIAETGITDVSIDTLLGLTKMRMLYMNDGISPEGRERLEKALVKP